MPNQAEGSKQKEVKLLTKMTLSNHTKHNEVRLKDQQRQGEEQSWKKRDMYGKQGWQKLT